MTIESMMPQMEYEFDFRPQQIRVWRDAELVFSTVASELT